MTTGDTSLDQLVAEIRACRVCADHLPLGPRPVVRLGAAARLLIVGQAPGTKVHASGVPFDDASGATLRRWLGLGPDLFYDTGKVALAPTGLCYPGRAGGGDAPPRPECAPLWQARIRASLPAIGLTLLVGAHAQAWHLGPRRRATLAETCRNWAEYGPTYWPIPHPSPRNRRWLRLNDWFEAQIVPALQERLAALLAEDQPLRPE